MLKIGLLYLQRIIAANQQWLRYSILGLSYYVHPIVITVWLYGWNENVTTMIKSPGLYGFRTTVQRFSQLVNTANKCKQEYALYRDRLHGHYTSLNCLGI